MLIRMQERVPEVYVRESRDYQLLCRLMDAWMNSSKLDADLMPYTADSFRARNNTLNLLQTKLGFFTKHELTDVMMRYFLCVFPDAVRWKGSFKGLTYAINSFIKALNIKDKVLIGLDTKNEFNIIIRTTVRVDNIDKLEEFLKYIIPVGFTYEFQFYTALPDVLTDVTYETSGAFIVADNKTNASIRYATNMFDKKPGTVNEPVFIKDDYLLLAVEPLHWDTEYFRYFTFDGTNYIQVEVGSAPPFYNAADPVTYFKYNETRGVYEILLVEPADWNTNFYNYYYFDLVARTYYHVGHEDHLFAANTYYKHQEAIWDQTVTNVGLAGLSGNFDSEGIPGSSTRVLKEELIGDEF